MTASKKASTKPRSRYGIGEWYGRSFVRLSAPERTKLASIQAMPKKSRPTLPCPFRTTPEKQVPCTKQGGVCSIRLYRQDTNTGLVSPAPRREGSLVTTCPYRFQQNGSVFSWVGETLLGHARPIIVGEVGFLEHESDTTGEPDPDKIEDVGRIDNVLVHPSRDPLQWCALEIQAVYFSGTSMTVEFNALRRHRGSSLAFPEGHRRPDYRSSGPKRLMPQLQIKVPTLWRWGKKVAVVVDRSFFEALGRMDDVRDVSNCDIAWFVVSYRETAGEVALTRDFVRLTTLERAVEGLTGGRPVSRAIFEDRIREKLPTKG